MEAEKAAMAAAGQAVQTQGKIVLATVKGDVHDIGKNIVGVVLACNNYEVIDMGVMVPCEKILERAKLEKADLIGLSGLITPSLDEMVHVAREMERQGFKLPLLIGGATTSRAHTAVKIAPHYSEPVVHVLDASRAVPVTTQPAQRRRQGRLRRAASRRLRAAPRACTPRPSTSSSRSRPRARTARRSSGAPRTCPRPSSPASACSTTFRSRRCASTSTGRRSSTPGSCKGVYPRILEHEKYGEQARKLFAEANALLDEIIAKKLLTARGVYGLFPANAVGDDVELYTDEARSAARSRRFHFLRQQADKDKGEPNRSPRRLHRARRAPGSPTTSAPSP